MFIEVKSEQEMRQFGKQLGQTFQGGEVVELIGDVGAGKTSLTKGIAQGLSIDDEVQSPTFTISRQYEGRDNIRLAHYDFYRISDAGIMADELQEVVGDPKTVTVVEWSEVAKDVLPDHRIKITISSPSCDTRNLEIEGLKALEAIK